MPRIKEIIKRDGKRVPFDSSKISNAICNAANAVAGREGKQTDKSTAELLSVQVVATLEYMFRDIVPTVEQVQDIVEKKLIENGHAKTAKAYILYREEHRKRREMDVSQRNVFDFSRRVIRGYVGGADWRSRENANSGQITFQGANARLAGDLWNTFALHEIYETENPEIPEAHKSGQMHIHDLDFPVIAYCCGHSLEKLLEMGFGHVKERVQSSRAKHLRSAVSQMVNYIGTMQGEFAGAQAFSSIDTFLAPYVRVDNLSFNEVKQCMQELVYGLNVPSRWGWQAPFSNLTFDLAVPGDLKNKKIVLKLTKEDIEKHLSREKQAIKEMYGSHFAEEGIERYIAERRRTLEKMVDSTYEDYQKEMDVINLAYLEVKKEGDRSRRIFTFPIDTYNITRDFNWDSDVANLLFEVAGKYGTPYFQNYVGSGLDPGAIRAMCCRLNLDQRELMKRPGSLWGPGDSTGSIGVVTINMNRIGFEAEGSKEKYFRLLGHRMDLAKQALEMKRKTSENLLEQGLVPYTKVYLGHFMNHFSTIGLVGMHDSLVNFMGEGIDTEEGRQFAIEVLNFMREKTRQYQEETGNLYNLEATPAESTSYRLARLDKEKYPHIYTSGDGEPFLTNSTQLPVNLRMDLFSALKHQEDIQALYTGGTIFHTFIGEEMSGEAAKTLVRKIVENTKLPYFSLTPVFSVCDKHGYIRGKREKCPVHGCDEKPEIYDRIVGYFRPVASWNLGKQEEFRHRNRVKMPEEVYVKV